LAGSSAFKIDRGNIETNIVIARVTPGAPDAATIVARARSAGVLLLAFGPRLVRAVTHLSVRQEDCVRAGEILVAISQDADA